MRSLIETERLSLGLPEPADARAIVAYYRENRAHLEPWSPTWPAGFFTEEFWRDQARSARQDFRAGTAVRMIIALLAEPRRIVGNVSLTQIFRGPAHLRAPRPALAGAGAAYAAAGDRVGAGQPVRDPREPDRHPGKPRRDTGHTGAAGERGTVAGDLRRDGGPGPVQHRPGASRGD